MAEAQLTAKRPRDMSLDNTKARESLGRSLGALAEHFQKLRSQEHAGLRAELAGSVIE
jgi:hypothetical protein